MSSDKTRSDIHQTVTDRIITMLETAQTNGGALPWTRPGVAHSRPINAITQKPYRGINVLSLWASADAACYRTGLWATFKQWKELGAFVKKGEKASPIVFYKSLEIDDDTVEPITDGDPATKTIRMARGYWGFNADQVDGFTIPALPTDDLVQRIAQVDTFIANTKADIRHGGVRAYYRPADDFIQMPDRVLFRDTPSSTATEGFYAVLFHELGHLSGAKHRLNRELSTRFGDASYALEEMIAEWTSGFLCADLGITAQPREDHAHYIANWLTVLKNDNTAVFAAAAKANQAVEYLFSLQGTADARATEIAS